MRELDTLDIVGVLLLGLFVRKTFPSADVTTLEWFAGLATGWKAVIVVLLIALLPNLVIYVGEFWHYSVVWLTGGFVSAAEFVDRKTPDGTIGLIGLALALRGFVLQIVGTLLSANMTT